MRVYRSTTAACGVQNLAPLSGLDTHVGHHLSNAATAIDPHLPCAPIRGHSVVRDADRVAGGCEQIDDVLRVVREVVAQILVGPGAVDETAAVCPDACPDERPWLRVDQALLPRLEDDSPLVFHPGRVLRKEASKMRAIHGNVHASPVVEGNDVDRVVGEAMLEQTSRGSNDSWVLGVQRNPKALRPGTLRDAAVA